MTPEILAAARQAAREAVDNLTVVPGSVFDIRVRGAKHADDESPAAVTYAILGAEAAIAAVLPMVVRQCAGVAKAEGDRLAKAYREMVVKPGVFGDVARDRRMQSLTAGEIEQSILALIGEDSVSQSPAGRIAADLRDLNGAVAEALALIPAQPVQEDKST